MIVGRTVERARLDALMAEVAEGRGAALVLRGEPGIGKSTLLGYVRDRAPGLVVDVTGVESESELAYAGLSDVLRPLAWAVPELPPRQADDVRSILSLDEPARLDRLTVGVATLALLAAAAPLTVLVDDAHWLDRASQEALVFAARRLAVDPVAVMFAARDTGDGRFVGESLEEIRVTGLGSEAARELLRDRVASAAVADLLIEQTAGNPLALLELPEALTDAQLRGEDAIEQPLKVTPALERAFARRVLLLGEPARQALVTAAADTSGDAESVSSALRAQGLGDGELDAAEDAGLIARDASRLRFSHPLVRSAVFHGAAPSERRRAHAALAAALAGRDERRRAWHLAGAATGPDDEAAAAMEALAADSESRGAFVEAAAAYEHAARLTTPAARARLLASAADAARLAGRMTWAAALIGEGLKVDEAEDGIRGALLAGNGFLAAQAGRPKDAVSAFLEAAPLLDGARAFEALAGAVGAAIQVDRATVEDVVARLRALGPADEPEIRLLVLQALGGASSVSGDDDSQELLGEAADLVASGMLPLDDAVRLELAARVTWAAGRNTEAHTYARRAVDAARADGAVGLLAASLRAVAVSSYDTGSWSEAYAAGSEAALLAEPDAQGAMLCGTLGLLAEMDAAAGNEEACREHAGRAIKLAIEGGLGFYRERAERAIGRLELLTGSVESAATQLEGVFERLHAAGNLEINVTPVWDLLEAYVRLGRAAAATRLLAEFEQETPALDAAERALFERAHGLVADDYAAHFERALTDHDAKPFPYERARTQLCYGERLRRDGERSRAREQLRAALESFDELGAAAFARRAAAELRASGARRRDGLTAREHLTPRELQIAHAVAEGKSNKEVAALLFVTPKTIEFHLTRVFRKVGVRSRAELVRRFADRRSE
jgi:DNA-binding CsgD family transcriptional regulator